MRTFKILFVLLILNITMIAQDENYKGPAKVEVKIFWRQTEPFNNGKGSEMNLKNMQKALAGVKEKDPSYNTSAMEEELKKWKEQIAKVAEESKPEEQKNADKKVEEAGYNGPAKNKVAHFWQYASKPTDNVSEGELNNRIYEMDYALKGTKEKDPAYNTAEMEAELNKLKGKKKDLQVAEANKYTGDKVKDSQKATAISNDPGLLFEDLFENENLQAGAGAVTGEKLKLRMENYKEKATKLLGMDYGDAKINHTRISKGTINGMKMNTEKKLSEIDMMLEKYTDKKSMEVGYYTIQFHLAYWDAAQKVFSEEASYKEMYNKVKTSADKMGSLESMTAKADANTVEKIKNTKLPNPVVKDAGLEKILMDGFNKKFGAQYNVSALKVVLTQDGWTTLRNSLTSVIMGRERSAKIAYKGNDGKCYMIIDYVFIHEEYIGGAFTNTKAVYNGLDGKEMLCENVK